VLALVLLAAYIAVRNAQDRSDDPRATPPPAEPDDTAPGSTAAPTPADELLASLVVVPEAGSDGYEREAFGDGWRVGADGCEVRLQVLVDESRVPATRGSDGCSVERGDWLSIYDGYRTPDPSELEVDHLVPLAEAWESGASAWPAPRREDFANDLDRPDALIAVTAATNRSKSDRDPAEWMPPNRDAWCRYAGAYVAQKAAWELTIDPAERDALRNVLAGC
jgi:hypothetical protein